MEPNAKRIKLDTNASSDPSSFQIKSILSDDLLKAVDTIPVYTISITDSKSISQIMSEVNRLLPMSNLQHLKRIKNKDQMILCPVEYVASLAIENVKFADQVKDILPEASKEPSDEMVKHLLNSAADVNKSILLEFLQIKGFKTEMTEKLASNVSIQAVPSVQPKLRWQHSIATAQWPCKFHLNVQLEDLYNDTVFDENEKNFHKKLMALSLFVSSHTNGKCVGVVVDPRNGHIVAVGGTRIDLHPLMHCSMVLIDMVSM